MLLNRVKFLVVGLLFLNLAHAAPGQPFPAEAWQRKAVGFAIGLCYLKMLGTDPVKAARTLAADKRFALKIVDKLDKTAQSQALLSANFSSNVTKEYAPPSIESLRYFGRGLSQEQALALQKAPRALILGFAHPSQQKILVLRRAEEFILELAKQEDAIIWDDETREAFTPEAWEKNRLRTWEGGIPDVSKQIVIHGYNNAGRSQSIGHSVGRQLLANEIYPGRRTSPSMSLRAESAPSFVRPGVTKS